METLCSDLRYALRRLLGSPGFAASVRMGPYIGRSDAPWATVVGVVGDVKQSSLAVRTLGDPEALVPNVKRAIWSVDSTSPVVRVATMSDVLGASEAVRRFALVIFAAFGVAAVVLAIVGLYGVVAGSVEECTREIGVRAALGASPARVAALVVRQGMVLASLGVLLGVTGAAAATGALSSLLFGVTPLDAWTYGGTIALLAGMSLLACVVPAARAAQIDPATTLRAE